jgi:hypothetical protein
MDENKSKKKLFVVIAVVIVIVAGLLLYGGFINQPHLQTPTVSQIDSATGNSYNQTSTSHSINSSFPPGVSSADSANYSSGSGSTIDIIELEFSNNTAAKLEYNSFVSSNLSGLPSFSVNLTYKSFTYTVLGISSYTYAISFSGKFFVFIICTGLSTNTASAVLKVTVNSMTSFSI